MYFVYAIKSQIKDWIYVGITSDVERRFTEHNSGKNRSTKPYKPFSLIYTEIANNREDARIREKYLKSGAGKRWLKKFVEKYNSAGLSTGAAR